MTERSMGAKTAAVGPLFADSSVRDCPAPSKVPLI